jgi:hypothetical protein
MIQRLTYPLDGSTVLAALESLASRFVFELTGFCSWIGFAFRQTLHLLVTIIVHDGHIISRTENIRWEPPRL